MVLVILLMLYWLDTEISGIIYFGYHIFWYANISYAIYFMVYKIANWYVNLYVFGYVKFVDRCYKKINFHIMQICLFSAY